MPISLQTHYSNHNCLSLLFGTQGRPNKKQGLVPGKAPQGPAHFQSSLFFDSPHPEGDRDGTRKEIKLWTESLIINSSWELGFRDSSHSSDFLYQVLAPHHSFPCPLATLFPLSHSQSITRSCGCSCPPLSSPKFSHFSSPTAFFSIQANTHSKWEGHISQQSCPLSTLQLEEGSLQRFLLFPG